MSSFKPLNFLDDSKKDSEEEHTRELQVEQAYNLFQSALKFHNNNQLHQSYKVYENLFKLDIISNHYLEEVDYIRGLQNGRENLIDELSLLSPNVKSLRYLIFRNRGMLFLEMLKKSQLEDSQFKEMFYTCIDDLCIAFFYNEADEKLLDIILDVYLYLGTKKLSKYTLEYQLSSIESDDLPGLLPIDESIRSKYEKLLQGKLKPSIDLDFLKPIKDEFIHQSEEMKKNLKVITCKNSWTSLIDSMNLKLKDNQDEKFDDGYRPKSKYVDPYVLTEEPFEIVKIEIVEAEPEPIAEEVPPTPPKIEEKIEVEEIKDEPAETKIQRSSKRLAKVESTSLPEISLQESHFYGLNKFIIDLKSLLNVDLLNIRNIYLNDAESPQYVQDFIEMIGDWKYDLGLLSFQTKADQGDNLELLDLLSDFSRDEKSHNESFPPLGPIEDSVISEIDYIHLKKNIINYLINTSLSHKWDDSLYTRLKDWILQFDNYITPCESAIGIFEFLIDASIALEAQIKEHISKKSNRGTLNPLCQDLLKINDKIQKWSDLIEENLIGDELISRFKWAQFTKEKSTTTCWNDNSSLTIKLHELLQYDIPISYPNYRYFQDLNIESIKNQLTIISVLSIFWRILYSSPKEKNNEAIELLEDILMESSSQDKAILSIKKFLAGSSIEMRLSLWNILLSFYKMDDTNKLTVGFEKSLEFLNHYLLNEYKNNDKSTRFMILSKIIGFFNNNIVESKISLPSIVPMFELCLFYEIHEEASSITALKSSIKNGSLISYNLLKDMFIKTCVLILTSLDNSILHEGIRLFHRQLGSVGICDAANGAFLKACQDFLNKLPNNQLDICQIIKCKFHYSIVIGGVIPEDHGTERLQVGKQDCENLAKFILPVSFRSLPKHDVKQLVDEIYETVGDPDFESEVLSRNKASLNYFLDSTKLTSRFVRDSFYGLNKLEFDPIYHPIIQDGLYYIQGMMTFSSYKLRKKNMQSRAVEVETAITLFENDLIYGSNRLESWYLLGQAYGYLVEDDLIWTSDKLTIPERKIATANLQRKSLICYLMAINCTVDAPKENVQPIIGSLMSCFAKEMYGAVMQPMDMQAFKVQSQPKFINKPSGASFLTSGEISISKNLCLKIMKQSLQLAIKSKNNDWNDFYYLSKVLRKLGEPCKVVLNTMNRSCNLAHENIIEPSYTMISFCMKYVSSGELTVDEAVEYLSKDPIIQLREKKDFNETIIDCLKKVDAADKKKWQHKPKYRLAKLFSDAGQIKEAIEVMSNFITPKTPNKPLVSVWKPESERPGKHFLYTFNYIYFYIELLKKSNDLVSLFSMLPKLRRSNSVMIRLSTAWEFLCSSICKIIRDIFEIEDGFQFTDKCINNISAQRITVMSKSFHDLFTQKGVPDDLKPHLCFLSAANDMKKLNNGYGPTSLIDDTVVGVFFRIYLYYDSSFETNDSKKKIAKKDIFPLANDLVKTFRKEIDEKLKDDPELFNILAKKRDESKKQKLY